MLLWVTWSRAADLLGKTECEVRQLAWLHQWNYTLAGVEIRLDRVPVLSRRTLGGWDLFEPRNKAA